MDVTIEFCPITAAEAGCIGPLRQRCWAATYRGIYPDEMIDAFDYAWHAERDRAFIRKAGNQTLLILVDGKTAGYMSLQMQPVARLLSLYLLPEYQHHGVGRRAFEWMRSLCRETGAGHFQCDCHPDNAQALAFYQRMGGIVTAREDCPEHWQSGVTLRFDVPQA